MEILQVVNHQYAFLLPVALVIICAGLLFAFGIKPSVEPPSFKQLSFSSDDRKQGLKKKKIKDKKSQSNGHATVVIEDPEAKKSEVVKPLKQSNKIEVVKPKKGEESDKPKEAKKDVQKSPVKADKKVEKKSGKENQVEVKNKKNKSKEPKPDDFDDGTWETAVSRKDKKNKKKDDDLMSYIGTDRKMKIEDLIGLLTPEKKPKKKATDSPKKTKKEEKPAEIIEEKNEEIEIVQETPAVKEIEIPEEVVEVKEIQEKIEDGQEEAAAKKKKAKKQKPPASPEKTVEEVIPVVKAVPEPNIVIEKKVERVVETPKEQEPVAEEPDNKKELPPGPVFDELGDAWKDAPQKKSKKKVRKD